MLFELSFALIAVHGVAAMSPGKIEKDVVLLLYKNSLYYYFLAWYAYCFAYCVLASHNSLVASASEARKKVVVAQQSSKSLWQVANR